MMKHIAGLREIRSPYSPNLIVLGGKLISEQASQLPKQTYVAGKGFSKACANLRLLGEAAERETILRRSTDSSKPLIDHNMRSIGIVPPERVLVQDFSQALGSTGCASHNLMQSAIWNAVKELIERRAVALWWERRISAFQLKMEGPLLQDVSKIITLARRGAYEQRLTDFYLLVLDGPIRVVAARSSSIDFRQIAIGFAADLDIAVAVERAFLELLSVELETADLFHAKLTARQIERQSSQGLALARQRAFETTHRDLFEVDCLSAPKTNMMPLSNVLSNYVKINQEILLADLTRPEIGLPTCRAFFREPSLQPITPEGFDLYPL